MTKTIKEMRKMDQFFTKESVSLKCIDIVKKYIDIIKPSITSTFYIEPSAGNGDFYSNMPEGRSFAFDIERPNKFFEDKCYFEWDFLQINFLKKDLIYIGNPPFGKRGMLAFDFIMKCIELDASLIAFILPPNINSKARTDMINESDYRLVYSERLLDDSFYFDIDGEEKDMVAESIFQIYIKKEYVDLYNIEEVNNTKLRNNDFVKVYTINNNVIKNSSRNTPGKEFRQDGVGRKWVGKCDFYIPLRVFHSKGVIEWYDDFNDPGMSNIGFGVICEDKNIKNKINLRNCYTLGTNKVLISKKQLILKEIMREREK